MRGLRNLQILSVACSLVFGLGGVGWAQDNNGQNGTNPTQPPNKPVKPPLLPGDGADSGGPFTARSTGTQIQSQVTPNVNDQDRPRDARLEQDQAKMRNADRQKQLVNDTEKLVSLANELKLDVGKSNKDMLSLDVIKKADEIEKLARSVKEKMKGT